MAIVYLDPANVIDKRQTAVTPPNRSVTGYGNKIPTSWQIKLKDKRWRRVYVICWSNSGSAYIKTKNGNEFLGSFDPRD